MKLPIVRLIGRDKIKVIYAGKKWAFARGVDYTDVHPSFSAHLVTLKNDQGEVLFEIEHPTQNVKATREKTIEATNEEEALRKRLTRKSNLFKEKGRTVLKKKPTKVKTKVDVIPL